MSKKPKKVDPLVELKKELHQARDEASKYLAEISRLHLELESERQGTTRLMVDKSALQCQVRNQRKALEFYADIESYKAKSFVSRKPIMVDAGQKANDVLELYDEEDKG